MVDGGTSDSFRSDLIKWLRGSKPQAAPTEGRPKLMMSQTEPVSREPYNGFAQMLAPAPQPEIEEPELEDEPSHHSHSQNRDNGKFSGGFRED
jgi:hypothetical protein